MNSSLNFLLTLSFAGLLLFMLVPKLYKKVRHEDIWRSGGIAPLLLTSALDGGFCATLRTRRFTPEESARRTHSIGGGVNRRTGLDAVEKEKKILLLPGIEFRPSSL
jgi:hypothetical protein